MNSKSCHVVPKDKKKVVFILILYCLSNQLISSPFPYDKKQEGLLASKRKNKNRVVEIAKSAKTKQLNMNRQNKNKNIIKGLKVLSSLILIIVSHLNFLRWVFSQIVPVDEITTIL